MRRTGSKSEEATSVGRTTPLSGASFEGSSILAVSRGRAWVGPFSISLLPCLLTDMVGHRRHVAPTKTFLLLLAPRSFRSPLFLPRQNLSARLGTLLAPAPTPYAASAKGQERKATTTSRIATEGVTLELDETDVGTIRVERGVGRSGLEKGEEDERIWFVWEGGTLNGWRD